MGTAFTDLEKDTAHNALLVPQYSITVGNTKILPADYPVLDLDVLMSAGYDMSSCEFTIAPIFDRKTGEFEKDIIKTFKPGQVVDVQIGYSTSSLKGVFMGYINALSYNFDGNNGPLITVQCLDAKGALVNNRTWKNYGQQDIKSIVSAILQKRCKTFVKTIPGVESDFDAGETGNYKANPEIKENVDDYHYLIHFAEKTNNSFCVIYSTLYFCENRAITAQTEVKLEWGKSLLNFSSEIDLSNQIGTVLVYGSDPITKKVFTGKAEPESGTGESGPEMASFVKNKTMVLIDNEVINKAQADELAKHTLEKYMSKLANCKGSTVGLPEIKAGDNIEISGIGKGVDGEYFLNKVTHRINANGYITSFEGRTARVVTQ